MKIGKLTAVSFWTYEVNADCGNVGFSVCIISKSQKETRFTNSRVSNEEELEKIVARN